MVALLKKKKEVAMNPQTLKIHFQILATIVQRYQLFCTTI